MTTSPHFNTELGGQPTSAGRFVAVNDIQPIEFVEGLEFRPVLGERTMANFVHFAPHTEAPTHVHEEEQIVIMVEGELEFDIEGESRLLRSGDVAVVPPWVSHGARTKDAPCLEVDVFNPPRQTLLNHATAQISNPE